MRVCIIDSSDFMNFPAGGQVSFIHDFIQETIKEDLEFYLVGITREEKEKEDEWSFRIIGNKKFHFLPIFKIVQRSRNRQFPLRFQILLSAFRARKKLLERNFEVLYIHTPEMLFPFIYHKKTKIIVHTHGLWEHTSRFSRYKWVRNRVFAEIFRKLIKFALRKADKVIVVNRESLEFYGSLFPFRKDKMTWIPTGVNVRLFRPMDRKRMRDLYGFREEDEIIIFSGRLSWNKGLDLLVESFKLLSAELPKAKLVLVGDGEQKGYLVEQASAFQIKDKTVFLGERSRRELPMIMNCADVFALTSFVEGMPIAVLESLACGIPVVAVNVGDVSKVIINGMTGYTVKERDPGEFRNRLLAILRNGDSMKGNCVKISQEYAMSSIAGKILKVLTG